MSMSFYAPPLATNLSWTGAYSALDPNNLANVANQNKSLYLDGSNALAFGSNGIQQPVITDANGMIPSSLIPASFDDIREYPTVGDFPAVGDNTNGILYYAVDTGYFYKWNAGTLTYINISTVNFYNKTQIDDFLNTKLNKTGDTMTGTLNMNSNAITNIGTITTTTINGTSTNTGTINATTSNLGTLGSNVNLGLKNLTNGSLIACDNITCPNIATTTLHDIGGVSYVNLASNIITMSKPILMGNNTISGASAVSAHDVRIYQINSEGNGSRSIYFEDNITYFDKNIGMGSRNISDAGTVSTVTTNATTINTTNMNTTTATGTNANFTTVTAPNVNATTATGTNANFTTVTAPNVNTTTATGTNANFTNISVSALTINSGGVVTGIGGTAFLQGQSFTTYNIIPNTSGQVTLSLPALNPIASIIAFISSILVTQSDDSGSTWTTIPEYGDYQGTLKQWWRFNFNTTTRVPSVVFTDIGDHGHFFDSFGIISFKIIFNVS